MTTMLVQILDEPPDLRHLLKTLGPDLGDIIANASRAFKGLTNIQLILSPDKTQFETVKIRYQNGEGPKLEEYPAINFSDKLFKQFQRTHY